MLRLGSNQIKDEGATALMAALRESQACRLRLLDLRNNNIGAEGAKAISEALVVLASITSVR